MNRNQLKIERLLFLLALIFLLVGCSDDFYSFYPDMKAAQKDEAVERGWIPKTIPSSATEIHELHNLDTNEVWMRFDLKDGEREKFKTGLRRLSHKEILQINLRKPYSRAPWWFDGLIQQEPANDNALNAEIYRYDSERGFFGYFAFDRSSPRVYYWSSCSEKKTERLNGFIISPPKPKKAFYAKSIFIVLFSATIGTAFGALFGGFAIQYSARRVAKFLPTYGTAYKASFLSGILFSSFWLFLSFILRFPGRGFLHGWEFTIMLVVTGLLINTGVLRQLLKHPKEGRIGFGQASLISLAQILISFMVLLLAVMALAIIDMITAR